MEKVVRVGPMENLGPFTENRGLNPEFIRGPRCAVFAALVGGVPLEAFAYASIVVAYDRATEKVTLIATSVAALLAHHGCQDFSGLIQRLPRDLRDIGWEPRQVPYLPQLVILQGLNRVTEGDARLIALIADRNPQDDATAPPPL